MTDYVLTLDCGHEHIYPETALRIVSKWCPTCHKPSEARGGRRATHDDETPKENA